MVERELAVVQHRIKDHAPKVCVFTNSAQGSLTPAALKRHRFIQNLKNNHQKLIEALGFVERFAVICELSDARVQAIRKAKDDAINELTEKLEQKLKVYEARMREESR